MMRVLIAGTLLMLSLGAAHAVEPYAIQPREVPLLPDYCQVKMGRPTESEQRAWAARFGLLWGDMHHYCNGLNFVNRASRGGIGDIDRRYYLGASLGEFDYIIKSKNAAKAQWFLPEVHFQKASALRRLGRTREASVETQKAIAASHK
jgi:hypothetical protein